MPTRIMNKGSSVVPSRDDCDFIFMEIKIFVGLN